MGTRFLDSTPRGVTCHPRHPLRSSAVASARLLLIHHQRLDVIPIRLRDVAHQPDSLRDATRAGDAGSTAARAGWPRRFDGARPDTADRHRPATHTTPGAPP